MLLRVTFGPFYYVLYGKTLHIDIMFIRIENVNDGDVFPHEVVVVRGSLPADHVHQVELERDGRVSKRFAVVNKKFKALIKLKSGQNVIQFKCGSFASSNRLNIRFRRDENQRKINLVYILCKDGDKNPDIEDDLRRLSVGASLIECFIGQNLREFYPNSARKSVLFEPECRTFKSALTLSQSRSMNERDLWTFHAKELLTEYGLNRKFLAILSATKYENKLNETPRNFGDILTLTKAHAALGKGGLALFGSGGLYSWPLTLDRVQDAFLNDTRIDAEIQMDHSGYGGTFGACFAASLGSMIHELGHCLDLVHDEDGVMGKRFTQIHRFFVEKNRDELKLKPFLNASNSTILYHHKWLNSNDLLNEPKIFVGAEIRRSDYKVLFISNEEELRKLKDSQIYDGAEICLIYTNGDLIIETLVNNI